MHKSQLTNAEILQSRLEAANRTLSSTDQQQDLDIPSLRVDDGDRLKKKERPVSSSLAGVSAAAVAGGSERSGQVLQSVAAAPTAPCQPTSIGAAGRVSMSHIQGVKKPLMHANSFTGERLPKYGVETCHEEELGEVMCLALKYFITKYTYIKGFIGRVHR